MCVIEELTSSTRPDTQPLPRIYLSSPMVDLRSQADRTGNLKNNTCRISHSAGVKKRCRHEGNSINRVFSKHSSW